MKKVGMVGGTGPESTVDYYQRIIRAYRDATGDNNYPEILINSINMTAMLKKQADGDWDGLAAMLGDAIGALCRAGADYAFIASNTPHIVFSRLKEVSPIPLVSIVEAARGEAERLSLKKAGLLGTTFTMRAGFYQEEFEKSGIAIAVPNDGEKQYIQEKLFSEIELGVFLDETRDGLLKIVKRLIDEEAIDGVILGCTELPLILTEPRFGIPFINTTAAHVGAIMPYLLDGGSSKYKKI